MAREPITEPVLPESERPTQEDLPAITERPMPDTEPANDNQPE